MQKLFVAELLVVMVIFFINSGESLKCYVCRSDQNKGCNGKMDTSLSQTCPNKTGVSKFFCRKIKQKLKFKDEDHYTLIRECAYDKDSGGCYLMKWLEIAYQETCECDTELCNRGNGQEPCLLTVTVVLSLWILNYLNKKRTLQVQS